MSGLAEARTWQAWATALAKTAAQPTSTVTPEMLDATISAEMRRSRATLPFEGLGTIQLPAIDVKLEGAETAPSGADLVVRGLLAEGGMGKIYVADQRSLAREVAIKTVRDPLDRAQLDALLWEGAITGHLDHPGVTPVHVIGTSDGQPILVMKRISGLKWTDLLEANDEAWARFPALSKDRLRAHVGLLMEVARTIHFAHTRGVLHLDMKPDNVMIGEFGEVYVVDWGVATTFTGAGARMGFVGTPAFVAPEMVNGEVIGPHTDVFLLGATLHLILTRRPRHAGETFLDVVASAAESAPYAYPSTVPTELAELANACTARDPAKRPRDALAFRGALARHLEHATSLDLTKDGEAKLGEIGAMITRGEARAAAAVRLATETRYAFKMALDRWPENAEARAGLERTLALAARLEIERENAVGAREVIAEMAAPPPELEAEVTSLEAVAAERARSAVELEKRREDEDLGRGNRERRLLILTVMVIAAVGVTVTGTMMNDAMMGVLFPLAPILGGLAVLAVVTVVLRRGLMANAASRRILASVYLVISFMGIHRATAVFTHLDAAAAEVRSELLLVSAISSGVALFVSKRAWLLAAAPLVGLGGVLVWPVHANLFYDGTAFVTLGALLVALGRKVSRPSQSKERG